METANLEQCQDTLTFFSDASLKVNREDAIIEGVSVITLGETRDGRFDIDQEFIDDLIKFGNKSKKGIKSRFGHPGFSKDAVGTVVGRFKNFRQKGEKVLADDHLLESARKSPVFFNDPVDFLLDHASEAPEMFGASIVFAW